MASLFKRVLKVGAIGAALYYGAPYLASGTVGGTLLTQRLIGGGGQAPQSGPIVIGGGQAPAQQFIIGSPGLQGGYSGFEGGGAGGQIYSRDGGDSPGGISPTLLLTLGAGGFGLILLMLLLRR